MLVSRLFYKLHLCVVLIFRFSVFFPRSFPCPSFIFSLPGRRLPSQSDTCFRCGRKGTGAPTVEDTGSDTNLGPASERKPKAPLSPPPGASKASQSNDVDIIDNEETPGLLPDNCSS